MHSGAFLILTALFFIPSVALANCNALSWAREYSGMHLFFNCEVEITFEEINEHCVSGCGHFAGVWIDDGRSDGGIGFSFVESSCAAFERPPANGVAKVLRRISGVARQTESLLLLRSDQNRKLVQVLIIEKGAVEGKSVDHAVKCLQHHPNTSRGRRER